MYQIKNIVDGNVCVLHDQRSDILRVLDPRLILTINRTGQLIFKITPEHEYYHTIKKLESVIHVIEDGALIYEGRVIQEDTDFRNVKELACEGCMGYLLDSIQRPFSHTGSTRSFLEKVIEVHNAQVEPRKHFFIGMVNVVDTETGVTRECKKPDHSWNVIYTNLVEKLEGCLWVKYEDGKKYINYTHDHGGFNDQRIRFGVNLLDLNKYQDATKIVTCLIPYGADVEYQDELGERQIKTIDITSVNGGKDFIEADKAAIDQYGKIWATYQWTDITEPSVLLSKAKAFLADLTVVPDSMEVKALDLNYTGVDIRRLHVGRWTTVESKPHGVKKDMLLARLDLYLDEPQKGSISLGAAAKSFTASSVSKQMELKKSIEKTGEQASEEIRRKVENATSLITGGLGGYVVLDNLDPVTGKKMHPWRILVMNTPDKDTAKNVIQINQNGIGFSTTGINGPYRNAWTIDGNLVADFITTGTMLADRIRGGTLELGGAGLGRDGSIIVMDASGKRIGSWDKTGLTILKGLLQGVSAVFGGVDNRDGAIEVKNASGRTIGRWDKDGLYIGRGTIDVGPLYANDDQVSFGDFYVSTDGTNVLRSNDGSVAIQTEAGGPFGSYTAISLSSGSGTTQLSDHHLETNSIICKLLPGNAKLFGDNWWKNYTIFEALDYLYNKIESLG